MPKFHTAKQSVSGWTTKQVLTKGLGAIWQQEDTGSTVNLQSLLGATNTRPRMRSEIADKYVALKGIQENPTSGLGKIVHLTPYRAKQDNQIRHPFRWEHDRHS